MKHRSIYNIYYYSIIIIKIVTITHATKQDIQNIKQDIRFIKQKLQLEIQ